MTESKSSFTLSAFGDEIDDDLDKQLDVMKDLGIGYLELRRAWGTNVLELTDQEISRVKSACENYKIRVSCIGSPVGKSDIQEDISKTLSDLTRILEIAGSLETQSVRIFSFYPPEDGQQEEYVKTSVTRLGAMAELAEKSGKILLLENESGLVGDTPERCKDLVQGVSSSSLKFVWDTGNFPHAGVERPVDRGWDLLSEYTEYVQVKDAHISDRTITVAGDGDGQVLQLLEKLQASGYKGFLALEPHLKKAGQRGGFSGPDGMGRATEALRRLMAEAGCIEGK